jgi:phage shock protein PspC (stress-responsive transcriptional regulator)
MLTGVAAGVADYFGVDPTIVRIVLAVLAVAGPGVPLYLAGWLLIPDEGARQSVAADFIDSFSAR